MKLAQQIAEAINELPTFDQRMAAEAIMELLKEGVISEREAKRQLAANGIAIRRYAVHIGFTPKGNPRYVSFSTLAEAIALCSEVFQKSGIVLSITTN